jgi:hypothetical protein
MATETQIRRLRELAAMLDEETQRRVETFIAEGPSDELAFAAIRKLGGRIANRQTEGAA